MPIGPLDQNDNSKYKSNTFAAYIRNWGGAKRLGWAWNLGFQPPIRQKTLLPAGWSV